MPEDVDSGGKNEKRVERGIVKQGKQENECIGAWNGNTKTAKRHLIRLLIPFDFVSILHESNRHDFMQSMRDSTASFNGEKAIPSVIKPSFMPNKWAERGGHHLHMPVFLRNRA